ncbi:ferredoxin--NADP reductase [Chitinilyticum litopenaei]|uniref:ferredoxin--NADP(+) reductase n=2 Tax=Chitinilyticum piscinae TaxID=2866724 RepID=A0A8J7FMK5_9NEIS|nr:ferredoxin--NADP reductase [Chitinilyticum piscinae]
MVNTWAAPFPDAGPAGKWTAETITAIRHWSPTLLSFRVTRSPAFRFKPGHYARLALPDEQGQPVWRPYSLVSASHDDHLEFLVIRIPGGAFSNALARLQVGSTLLVEKNTFGFLTLEQLAPGKVLWLLASGTGLGPMMSILQEPATWRDFERIIVAHSVRHAVELAYREEIVALADNALLAEGGASLCYVPIVTRDTSHAGLRQRIPALLTSGQLEDAAQCTLDVAGSRLMVCGNPEMTAELRSWLAGRGFATTRRGIRGQMAFEQYW